MQLGAVQAEQNSFSDELLDGLGCDPIFPQPLKLVPLKQPYCRRPSDAGREWSLPSQSPQ